MTTDEIIESLRPYGRVSMFQMKSGDFSAECELSVMGVTATVKSGYDHATCLAAMTALQNNVYKLCHHKPTIVIEGEIT